ncbi:MAG TPA: hypothetical protein VKA46_01735 [Gemmataceae bacterium]|nr:hypothetical protein [Gemmataceae bacterium]
MPPQQQARSFFDQHLAQHGHLPAFGQMLLDGSSSRAALEATIPAMCRRVEEVGCLVSRQTRHEPPTFWFTRRDGTEGRVGLYGNATGEDVSLRKALIGLRAMLKEAKDDPGSADFIHEFSQVAEQMAAYLREHGDWPPLTPAA